MTKNKSLIHKIGVIAALILFLTTLFWVNHLKNSLCLGLRFISLEEAAVLEAVPDDYYAHILFNDVPAAIDRTTNTIYISQSIHDTTDISQLKGAFSSKDPSCTLRLVEDENYSNLAEAVKSGHSFKLLATTPGKTGIYHIVFTTLPVMNVDGSVIGPDEDGRELFDGTLGFWDCLDEETGIYRTQQSPVQWHIRGQTSSGMPKKPWKLSVKNKKVKTKTYLSAVSGQMMTGY